MQIINRPSGKYNGDADVRVVVLHHTAGYEASDLATLWGPAEVSIHAYITKAGTIYLGVPLGKRAWHAGSPTYWQGLTDINSYSIGVELENLGNDVDPFPQEQLDALDYFLTAIVRPQYGNLPITRHRDILAEKHDPADNFPWSLYSGGIAEVVARSTVTGEDVQPKVSNQEDIEMHFIGDGSKAVGFNGGDRDNPVVCVPSAKGADKPWPAGTSVAIQVWRSTGGAMIKEGPPVRLNPCQAKEITAPGYFEVDFDPVGIAEIV